MPSPVRVIAVTCAAIGALLLPARAQGDADSAPAAQASEQASPAHASPRAVMRAFLADAGEGRFRDAAALFEADAGGPEVAEELYGILNRTAFVDLDDLPDAEEVQAEGISRHAYRAHPPGRPDIDVAVRFVRGADGGWSIDRATAAGVHELYLRVRELPLVDDFVASLGALAWSHYELERRLPDFMTARGFVLQNWQWVGLFLFVLVGVVVDRLVRFLVGRVSRRLARSDQVRLDAEVLLSFQRPMGILFGVLAFDVLLPVLGLDAGILDLLRIATSFAATVAAVWAAYRLVDVLGGYLAERASRTANKFDDMLVPLVRRTLKFFVVVVGIVFIGSRLTEDVWSVVAGLGLGSLAVGFAARDSIENLFGTFTVLMDKPFRIGDWIIVGEIEGTVEQVGFRSTRLRTFYNSVLQVPNRTFISSNVDNMGVRRYRRIRTMLSLTYDTPPEKIEAFCEGTRQIIRAHPYTRKDYYHVYLNELASASLNVLLYCFVETPDWATELREKHRLFADILRLSERLGVGFAFPTQTIHVARPEDLQHPDRPASDDAGAAWGRRVADEVVEKTLTPFGGRRPPPVEIANSPVHGSEDEESG